jgi:predicted negative regulator of RcsB-dependent stress response
MKAICLSLLVFSSATFALSPLMGNYSVIKATCEDFSFVWKKHDKVTFTGDKVSFAGMIDSIDENKKCRFKDIYQLKNLNKDFTEGTYSLKASLAAITRVETCVGLEEELVMALPEQRKNLSVPAGQMIKEIVAQKKGRTIELKFSDQSTCDDLIKLELAH